MLSLIEVQCPHCDATGQIMMPPVDAILMGPCPQCGKLAVLFCGHVLALDNKTMANGSTEDRCEHLLAVLMEFLRDCISRPLSDDVEPLQGEPDEEAAETDDGHARGIPLFDENPQAEKKPISQTEFEIFRNVDLKLLDSKAYFKSVFDAE